MIIKIHNVETGEIIEREPNEQELEQFEKDKILANEKLVKESEKEIARKAILDKLGLTTDEAAALLS
jgi:hypothetical protein